MCLAPSLSLPLSIYTPSPPEKFRTSDTGLFPVVHATALLLVVCRCHPPSFSELHRGGPSSPSPSPLIVPDCRQGRPSHYQPSKSQQSYNLFFLCSFFGQFFMPFPLDSSHLRPNPLFSSPCHLSITAVPYHQRPMQSHESRRKTTSWSTSQLQADIFGHLHWATSATYGQSRPLTCRPPCEL